MKVVGVERLPGSVVAMTVEVGPEEFSPAMEKSFRKNAMKLNVPGFRKGKAPRKLIEKMYGVGVFYEDAVDFAYPDAYAKALEEIGVEPVEQADVSVKDLSEQGFSFEAKVAVYPEVVLGQYKGLPARRKTAEVSDADVDAEVERLRERNAALSTVEREAQNGDTAVIDFEGFVDDVAFEGGKAEGHSLELGSGQFIPGFEEQILTHKAGDSFDVNVSFPAEYHSEELAGKAAVFKVTLHEVKEKMRPELDDEFAKDVSEFETLGEFRADIRRRMEESSQKSLDDAYENALLDQVIAGLTADVPQAMIDQQLETLVSNLSYRLASQGMNLDAYLSMTGGSVEDIRRDYLPIADRQVRCSLAFDAVAREEKLEISDEELDAEYTKMAEQYHMEASQIKKVVPERQMRGDLLSAKAANLIKDSAVEGDPPEPVKVDMDKAPAAEGSASEDKPGANKPEKKPRARKASEADKTEPEAKEA